MGAESSSHSFVAAAHAIEGGLKEGLEINIKGTFLRSIGTRFAVNFHMGFSNDDIAFHFNPRFEEGGYVVCNTKQKGFWGREEKKMRNPFRTEKPFEIHIVVKKGCFQVMVDGDQFLQYIHRMNYNQVNYISVIGPVEHIDISFPVRLSKLHLSQGLDAGASLLCLGPVGRSQRFQLISHPGDSGERTYLWLALPHPSYGTISVQSTCLSQTPPPLVCHYFHTCYQAMWFHEIHCHQLWELTQVSLPLPASVSSSVQGA